MNPMLWLALANAILELGLRLYAEIKDDPMTPEEVRARAAAAFAHLTEVKAKIEAYEPIPS